MPIRTSATRLEAMAPFVSLVGLFTLGITVAAFAGACTKKKDKGGDGNNQEPVALIPAATPLPTATARPPAPTEGDNVTGGGVVPEGTTGSGTTLPRAELGLNPTQVEPLATEASVNAHLEDLARLTSLFELTPPAPRSLSTALSDLESKTEACVRSALQATRFETAAGGFRLATAFDFKKCVEESRPNSSNDATREWTANVQWAMRARCDNHDFSQYNSLPVSHPDVMRYLCHNATSGEFYAHVRFEALELDANKAVLRKYVRTRAFTGKEKDTCAFVLLEGQRKYGDCVAIDRIDSATGTRRYLEVFYPENKVVAAFDDQGKKITQSKVNVVVNNWQGDVQFGADLATKGTYQLSNGTLQVRQTNAFPWPAEYGTPSQLFRGTPATPVASPTTDPSQQQQQQQQQQQTLPPPDATPVQP